MLTAMSHESGNGHHEPQSGKSALFGFVQLDRTFHELSQNARAGDDLDLSEAFHVRGNLTWADILMRVDGKLVSLNPGMAVTVEIKTGSRRIIEYLISPLLRYSGESLRER